MTIMEHTNLSSISAWIIMRDQKIIRPFTIIIDVDAGKIRTECAIEETAGKFTSIAQIITRGKCFVQHLLIELMKIS